MAVEGYKKYYSVTAMEGIILCVHPTNERCRYIVMSSLIGWVHTKIIPAWNKTCLPTINSWGI